jgi:DNA invertase Pin-like site-specific DNA recombinase
VTRLYAPGTRAWHYGRKSTAQFGDEEMRSTTRQTDNSQLFAEELGVTLAVERECNDDAISGGDTDRLVRRQYMLDHVQPGEVVIMRDESRFSRRDGYESFGELVELAQRGVDVWFYQTRQKFKFESFGDIISGVVTGQMNREYRRQISRNVHESHVARVRDGRVVGRPTFGYDQIHKRNVVNPTEAAVITRAYARALDGAGAKRIATEFNAEGLRNKAGRMWTGVTIRRLLANALYRGEFIWNKTHGRNNRDRRKTVRAAASEWVRVPMPELRIVDDATWFAVQKRFATGYERLRGFGGGRDGRRDRDSEYLLTGLLRCGHCGGRIGVHVRPGLKRSRVRVYMCMTPRAACPHGRAVVPVTVVDEAVIAAIVSIMDASKAEILAAVRALHAPAHASRVTAEKTLARLKRETAGLTETLARLAARGLSVAAVETGLEDRQRQINALQGTLDAPVRRVRDLADIERRVVADLTTRRALLDSSTANKRRFLTEALTDLDTGKLAPIVVKSIERPAYARVRHGFTFEGRVDLRRFAGLAGGLPNVSRKDRSSGQPIATGQFRFAGKTAA